MDMYRITCYTLALCCLAPAGSAASRTAEAAMRLEWPGSLEVSCEVPLGAALLQLCCETDAHGGVRFIAGLDSPLVRLGPLAAAGLLREAGNPLGFGPGSAVAGEATGLRLEGSWHTAGGWSAEVMLIPEAFGLFGMLTHDGSRVLGCRCASGRRGPIEVDAVAAVSELTTGRAAEPWIAECATVPAGRILHGAARIGVGLRGFSAEVSGGMSAAERACPGWFVLGTAAFGRREARIDLLAAGASEGYLELGRRDQPGGAKAGMRLRLAGPLESLRAGYVMSVGLPGFAPGPFLPVQEELSLVVERRRPARGGAWEAGLSLSNRISTGSDGTRVDDPSGRLSAGWDSACFDACAGLEFNRDDGIDAEVSADASWLGGRGRAGGDVQCAWLAGGSASLSATANARYAFGTVEALLRVGIRGVRMLAGVLDSGEPWGALELHVRARGDDVPSVHR
jgi:hypothetical protein